MKTPVLQQLYRSVKSLSQACFHQNDTSHLCTEETLPPTCTVFYLTTPRLDLYVTMLTMQCDIFSIPKPYVQHLPSVITIQFREPTPHLQVGFSNIDADVKLWMSRDMYKSSDAIFSRKKSRQNSLNQPGPPALLQANVHDVRQVLQERKIGRR